jgi:malate permease and related proteins
MNSTLIQMTLIMVCGVVWRVLKPADLSAEQTRLVLTNVVYYLLLPAMIIDVLWKADIGWHSLQFSVLGISCIVFGIVLSWLVGVLFKFSDIRLGTMILAASFPNVTYLGLPVLEQVFGEWTRSIVIQIDLFAAAPLVLTLGIIIAEHYGERRHEHKSPLSFLNAPPFWAAAVAVTLNLTGITAPVWLAGVLQKFSASVVPLMLFSMGLALSWSAVTLRNIPYVLPVIVIKMGLMPLFAMLLVEHLTIAQHYHAPAVLDVAMPSMLLGVVYCDRYQLDSSLYAMMVTITTVLSLFSLPFWYHTLL